MENLNQKLKSFAELLEKEQIEELYKNNLACKGNIEASKVSIKEGNKYFRVDVGTSGKYIVDREGNIFGIKAYGVIHRGHVFGNLDTIQNYYWGQYRAVRKV